MKTLSTTSGRLVLSTKVNITHRVSLLLFLVLSFVGISGYSQNIYQYTDNSSGVPFFVNSNATGTNLTRGSGLTAATTCTGLTEGFGSVGWSTNTATAINTADANGQFVSLTITPKAGYRLNITGFTASLRAPSGGPTSVRYSYTIGTNPFVQNGDSFTPGTSATCSNSGAARVWASFPNIITTESVTFKIYGFNAGTGDLYLRSINVSGTIECNPAITASITPTSPAICVNDAVTLTGATSGGSVPALTHSWNLINGASFATLSNPTTNIANLVSGVSGGTATAQYTASYGSSPSCSVSATRDVVVNPLPSLILGANPAVCSGATSASLAYTNVIGTPNVYSINFDAAAEAQGFVDAINVSSTFATPISIAIPAGAAPGTYNATFVVENNTIGCESQVYNISVTVNPLPTLNITGASEVCENSSILLTGNSNHPSVTNAWSSSNTSFASTTTGNATSTIGGIAVGNAIITYTSTDDKGCINTATTSITITPQPTNTFTITESSGAFSNDATVCSGDEATIAASTGHTNYKFLDGATVLQNGASNTYTANYTSTKTISVEITGTNGCVKTFSTGITVGSCGVQNTTTGKNFFSISAALSSPTTLNGHTINVGPGTYEEAIIINKQITLLGNNGSGTKPLIFNTSASQVISVSAPNVKIDNFEITVAQTSSNLYGIRTTSSGSFDNLVIEDCHIKGVGTTGAPVFSSMGLLIGTFGGALNDKVTLTNNIIEHTGTSPLGRAVRLYNYNGSISGNTLKAWYSIQAGDSGNGDVLITNNELTGNAEINNITGVGTITGNNFYPSNAYGAGTDNCQLELKNISNPSAAVLVQNNTFNNYVNYGVFAGRVNNVTINNNVFTPSASATNFRSLTVNTKQRTTAVQTAFVNGITVTGNDFKGNGAAGQTGIGFEVANFDNVSSFGTIVLGNQNKFRENIAKPIWLSAETGTAPNTGFWQGIYASTMTPANVNIDASGNEFEIGGTLLGTNTLSTTQLFDLEDKIQHKVDLEALGFITIKSNNAFVTTNSFIAPNTNAQIQRAIDAVSNGFTINIKAGTYAKQIAANKSVFGTNGPHQFGLFIDKNNLTIKGYKADNTAVNSASDAAVVFTTGSTANFGPSGIFVQGNDVSIEGLKIGDNLNASDVISNNKTFEAIGENFSLTKSWLNPTANQGSIYFAEWDAAHPIEKYTISDNTLENTLISINSGVGVTGSKTFRKIQNNIFTGQRNAYLISFRGWDGANPVQGWITKPVGGAVVTGNDFSAVTGIDDYFSARGNTGGYDNSQLDWNEIWSNNTYGNKVVTLEDESNFIPRAFAATFPATRRISAKIQENATIAQANDVVLAGDGTYNENVSINAGLKLKSVNGASATIIDGNQSGTQLGTIHLLSNVSGASIGTLGKGFTIKGLDSTPGIEKAAIYLQGTQNNITIEGNIIEARGDAALMGEYNATNNGIVINANTFTGKTFNGSDPATGDQFTVPNVARQAIVFGGGASTTNTQNFTFTNNVISTTAAGSSAGNQLVTLDLVGTNNISGNIFDGRTLGFALRVRGNGVYEIHNNSFLPTYTTAIFSQNSVKNATCNWFGSDLTTNILSKVVGPATIAPWLTNGTDDQPSEIGFQPVSGACNGTPVIIASAEPDHIICGETSGSIIVTFSGGKTPFNIDWGTGSASNVTSPYTINNLAAGAYTITVTDASGSAPSATATIENRFVANTTANTYHTSIQAAIDAANSGDVIEVCKGNYGQINITKSITLKGANFGTACSSTRVEESNINGINPMQPAITISASNVTIDGFQINGLAGIGSGISTVGTSNIQNITIKNNKITNMMGIFGINAQNITTPLVVENNCISNMMQVISPNTQTIGIILNGISGTNAASIKNNAINGGFYGYLVNNVSTTTQTAIENGNLTGLMQGVAVVNTVDGTNLFASNLKVKGLNLSGFVGNHPTLPAVNHHAGIYTFTAGGSSAANALTVDIDGLTIDGTGKPNQASAGIYLGDFATGSGTFQNVTVTNSVIQNNVNRGISARGKVSITVTNSELLNNGGDAFGSGGNDGFGVIALEGASVNISNSKIIQPSSSTTLVTALMTGNGTTNSIVAQDNSITNPGNNAQARGAFLTAGTGTINATCNWWGGISTAVPPQITGAINYVFFRTDGTDTDNTTLGFQPAAGTCNGCPTGNLVTNTNTNEVFCTIQEAISDAQTLNGHTIEVASGTYNEQVLVNKEVTLKGVGAIKPIINFTGTPALPSGKLTIFEVAANKVTIENFEVTVDVTKLSNAVITSGTFGSELTVKNNNITPVRSGASSTTYANRNAIHINYRNFRTSGANPTGILIDGNTVAYNDNATPSNLTDDASFRSAVATDEGGLTISNNTFQTVENDIEARFGSAGNIVVTNNTLNGNGVRIGEYNAGAGSIAISGNTFNGTFVNANNKAALNLFNNNQNKATTILNNTFAGVNKSISLENYQNVNIESNTFTPSTGATAYRHIAINTKEFSSSSGFYAPFVSAQINSNTFNGSGTVGGEAIFFANQDNDNPTFGTFVLGNAGAENNFNAGIQTFIRFDNTTGTTNPNSTQTVPWNQNLDARFNKFDVGSGLQIPSAMNLAQRTALENALIHKPDNGALGLIRYFDPVHNVTQNTYFSTISPAIVAANSGDVIELAEWTFNERVVIDKSLTLQGVNPDKTLTVIDGTGLGNGDGIQIATGITNVVIKNLTLSNFAGASGNADAAIYAIGSNNGLNVDNVKISSSTPSGGSGIYANGPINGFTVKNSDISDRGPGARGIVVWNGFKENITITGNILNNNICCGIELQDGTASAVNISNNIVNIGAGDNGLGITGLRTSTGNNTISNNTITGGGRFGIELKNPSDNDGGANTTTVSNNTVTLSTQNADQRDRAGIAVFRRDVLTGNPDNHPDSPNGVIITGNTVEGYQQISNSEGFGIVVEGENHTISNNTLKNNDVGIQQQAGHLPFNTNNSGNGDQNNLADLYFGRGNSPTICNITLSANTFTDNTVNERIVTGGGTGTIVTVITPTVDDPTDVAVCVGSTASTSFTGNNLPGVVYNWTNSNAAIGLASSGTGNINFTSTNTTSNPITATITVTPVANGCSGTPQTFTITVNPLPTATVTGGGTVCAGETLPDVSIALTGASPWSVTYTDGTTPTTVSVNTSPYVITGATAGTYTVTSVTDANGCIATSMTGSAVVTVNPLPVLTCPANQSLCVSASPLVLANLSSTNPTGGTFSGNGVAGGIFEAGMAGIGTHTITYKFTDGNGCSATCTFNITVNALPTFTTSSANVSCNGGSDGSITVTTSASSPEFSINGGAFVSGISPFVFNGLSLGTYTVKIKDANGCESLTTNVIISQPDPVVATATPSAALCFGTNGSAALSATGGDNSFTFTSSGGIIVSGNTLSAPAGTYTITATDGKGCTGTVSVTINQPAAPLTLTTSKVDVLCKGGNTGTATVNASGGTTPYSYSWTGPNTQTSSTAVNLTAGVYTVTVTDANSCTATASVTITEPTLPTTITASSNSPVCEGSTLTLSSTPSSSTGGLSYSWSGPNSFSSNLEDVSVNNVSLAANGTYTVTVTDGNGCVASATTNVVVNPLPTVFNVTGTGSICNGNATPIILSGSQVGVNYRLTTTSFAFNGSVISGTGNSLTFLPPAFLPGTYTIVAINTTTGCSVNMSGSVSTSIAINPTLSVVSQTNVSCFGGNDGTLTANASAGTGTYNYILNGGAAQSSGVFSNLTAGTYTITAIDALSGCTATTTTTITQPTTLPSVTVASSGIPCEGNTVVLTATATGGTAPYTYSWNSGVSTTANTLNVTNSGANTLIVTDSKGCTTSSVSTTVTFNALPTPTITGNSTICSGTTLSLTANGGVTYSWSGPNGFTSSNAIITVNDAQTILNGTYIVTVTNANSCTATASVNVVVNSTPMVSVTPTTTVLTCSNPTASLTVTGGDTYSWAGPNSFSSTANQITANESGIYSVTATSAFGCTATASVAITEDKTPPTLSVSPTAGVITCLVPEITLTATSNGSLSWSNGASTSSITVSAAGSYSVTATSANGCTATSTVEITEDKSTPSVTLSPSTSTLNCNNTTATITATGGNTYSWAGPSSFSSTNAEITVNSAGTYIVTATGVNGCTATASVSITQEVPLDLVITNPATATSVDITAPSVTAGSSLPVGTILKYFSDADTTTLVTNPSAITVAGTYYIKAQTLGGCVQVKPVIVTVPVCPDNLVLVSPTDDIIGTTTKKAALTITATNKVNGGANASYQAGKSITLNPGTVINSGAVFKAEIKGCND